DGFELVVFEHAQARGEPGSALRAHGTQDPAAVLGQREPDASLVPADGVASHEAGFLQPRDELRHSGNGDSLAGGELAHANPGRLLDLDEERNLASRDAERVDLAAELAGQLQQDGTE